MERAKFYSRRWSPLIDKTIVAQRVYGFYTVLKSCFTPVLHLFISWARNNDSWKDTSASSKGVFSCTFLPPWDKGGIHILCMFIRVLQLDCNNVINTQMLATGVRTRCERLCTPTHAGRCLRHKGSYMASLVAIKACRGFTAQKKRATRKLQGTLLLGQCQMYFGRVWGLTPCTRLFLFWILHPQNIRNVVCYFGVG